MIIAAVTAAFNAHPPQLSLICHIAVWSVVEGKGCCHALLQPTILIAWYPSSFCRFLVVQERSLTYGRTWLVHHIDQAACMLSQQAAGSKQLRQLCAQYCTASTASMLARDCNSNMMGLLFFHPSTGSNGWHRQRHLTSADPLRHCSIC